MVDMDGESVLLNLFSNGAVIINDLMLNERRRVTATVAR